MLAAALFLCLRGNWSVIKIRTTLILGAGASQAYGYPLGGALRQNLITHLGMVGDNPASPTIGTLKRLDFTENQLREFQGALRWSGTDSVDELLEHRSEFIELGKAAIAEQLLAVEDLEGLLPGNGHWYQHLFKNLNTECSLEDFGSNALSIITFNYDQSLEEFLYRALFNRYGKGSDLTTKALQGIPIIHVHGTLGPLRWQNPTGRSYGYKTSDQLDVLRMAAKSIKIVDEEKAVTEEYKQARDLLKQSSRIVFLGFGYHPANVKRLFENLRLKEGVSVKGSFYGFKDLETVTTRNLLNDRFRVSVELGYEEVLEFLRVRVAFA